MNSDCEIIKFKKQYNIKTGENFPVIIDVFEKSNNILADSCNCMFTKDSYGKFNLNVFWNYPHETLKKFNLHQMFNSDTSEFSFGEEHLIIKTENKQIELSFDTSQ